MGGLLLALSGFNEKLGNFSARIKSINAFGDLEIEFNETLSVVGFNLSNFNASNTDIKFDLS